MPERTAMLRNIIFAVALAATGCGGVEVSAVGPRLVWVSPGIWVLEDAPYAVYYADGYYWRYDAGFWYRSPYYNDAFVRVNVDVVPRVVVGSYHPRHIRYHAPVHATARPIVRDHRAPHHHR
jgi:hypothetical protein